MKDAKGHRFIFSFGSSQHLRVALPSSLLTRVESKPGPACGQVAPFQRTKLGIALSETSVYFR